MRPKGNVEVIDFKPGVPNSLVARATLVCRDEAGVLWQFAGCYMVTDLSPYCEFQTEKLGTWRSQVMANLTWPTRVSAFTASMAEAWYREGLTVEQAVVRYKELT